MAEHDPVHALHTHDQVADEAALFREALEDLLEPGGLRRNNIAVVAQWFDGRIYRLLDAHEALAARPATVPSPAPAPARVRTHIGGHELRAAS